MSDPVTDFTTCPHWGQGGRYVVDPATGQRVPLASGPPAPPVAEASPQPPTKPAKKGQ